ncbi:MAG TPA: hypothetical protein VLB90_05405 [Pseudomonadales bacterium]|nr:hypothetical protein [Pseudomonadales bacterium]
MPAKPLSRIDQYRHVWSSLYLLLILLLTLAAVYTLAVSIWRGPWRDTWEAMPFIEKAMHGQAGWRDYWEQYGYSHRPLISRWFWVADLQWFAGSNFLLLAVSLLMQAITFLSVRAVLLRDASFAAGQRCIVLAGVIFCLLNITQVFNFLHTFDVQWFLVTGFVVLSLERILANAEKKNTVWLVVAWLCVFLASLNNFSALVMWPVEILLLLALRFSVVQITGFSFVTVLYGFLYFHDLSPGGNSVADAILQLSLVQWLQGIAGILVVFPAWYLSNPLSFQLAADGPLHMPWLVSWLAPVLMVVLLLLAFRCWVQGLLQRKKYTAVAWLGLSLILYGYGVGVVTALGRGFFWDNVYALRYQNIVLLFWIGVVLWLAASVRCRSAGIFTGACLLMAIFGLRAVWYHDLLLQTGNRTRDAHLALVVGLENQLSAIQATVSRSHLGKDSTYNLQHEAAVLRDIHTGPYAEPAWQVPTFDFLQTVQPCTVTVSNIDVHGDDASYARLSLDFSTPVGYSVIAWFDADKTAPGLLIATRADTFFERLQQSLNGFTDYAGFAKQLPQQKPDNIFARDGAVWCKLGFTEVAAQ